MKNKYNNTKNMKKGKLITLNKKINPYDIAFELSQKITEFKKQFADKPYDVIIYPHSWYHNHFELLIRNKDKNKTITIQTNVLLELINSLEILEMDAIKLVKINSETYTNQLNNNYGELKTPILLEFDINSIEEFLQETDNLAIGGV